MQHVILGMTSSMQCQVFGTRTGQTFTSEANAAQHVKKLGKAYPHLQFLVLPISDLPPVPNPLSPRMLSRADG